MKYIYHYMFLCWTIFGIHGQALNDLSEFDCKADFWSVNKTKPVWPSLIPELARKVYTRRRLYSLKRYPFQTVWKTAKLSGNGWVLLNSRKWPLILDLESPIQYDWTINTWLLNSRTKLAVNTPRGASLPYATLRSQSRSRNTYLRGKIRCGRFSRMRGTVSHLF